MGDLKNSLLWNDKMIATAKIYVEHLAERAISFEREPCLARKRWLSRTTSTAKENPQMVLYALGALKLYQPIFGKAIRKIEMCIDQPRLNTYENWSCSIDELLAWGESIKPKAQTAYAGEGEFHADDWCRFCRANGSCRAQTISAFEDFAEVVNSPPALLSPEETGDYLKKGATLTAWYEALKQSAFVKLLSDCRIPGYKIVEGRSSRTWTDQDAALEKLQAAGIERAVIYDSVPKSLAKLEKMLGVAKFKE